MNVHSDVRCSSVSVGFAETEIVVYTLLFSANKVLMCTTTILYHSKFAMMTHDCQNNI